MSFKATSKRNLQGLIVGVPLGPEDLAICVVLWGSRHWKNVILLGITDSLVGLGDEDVRPGNLVSMVFTGAQMVRKGDWKHYQQFDLSIPSQVLTYKAAEVVWCGDTRVGPWDSQTPMPELRVAGGVAVESYLRFLFDGREGGPKLFTLIRDEMAPLVAGHLGGPWPW